LSVKNIPDGHHVVRHCKKRQYYRTDNGIRAWPDAFHLRPATAEREQEKYLSGIYFEFFDGDASSRMKACRGALTITVKPKDALLRVNVALVKEQGKKRSLKLRVTHESMPACHSYAAIRGIPLKQDDELAALLADLAVVQAIELSELL
jgi:hypothetical protein